MKYRSGGPGLRYVRAGILNRKRSRSALEACIEFRQAIAHEVARGFRDVARDPRGFTGKSISLETKRDDAVVMRPDGPTLVGAGVVGRVLPGQRANPPSTPHVRPHQPL